MSKKVDYVAFAQTAATVEADFPVQRDRIHRGVKVVFVTTVVGTGVTATIQGYDRLSGKYWTLLAGAAVATNTTNVYTVYPELAASANVTAKDVLPDSWRVKVVPTTQAITAAVSATKTFTVAGDQHLVIVAAATIRVSGSTGNDGLYTVVSSTFDTDHTDIVVSQVVPDATADGVLVSAASYSVGVHLIP